MNITEIRVKMVGDGSERLRAFCSVTLDGSFVIRDLKIIDGANGPFVAMPSRKLSDRCLKCGCKNHLRARYCNDCGTRLNENRAPRDSMGRVKLHADVAHPINAECRARIQDAVIDAYHKEMELAKQPGYEPRDNGYDDYEDVESSFDDLIIERPRENNRPQRAERPFGERTPSNAPDSPIKRSRSSSTPRSEPAKVLSVDNQPGDRDDDFGAGIL